METKTKNQWIILEDEGGERKRYNLASMQKLGIQIREGACATGVSLKDIYYMPRKKRVILEIYSIWERGHSGMCVGRNYRIADADTIARLAERTGNEVLTALVPEDGEETA